MGSPANAIVVSSPRPPASAAPLGGDNYSYSFAVRQFRPLFSRWGAAQEVDQPESRVEFSMRRFRLEGRNPFHLGFAPLHTAYLARNARNAAFVFWEYPDLLCQNIENDPRYNWASVANRFDLLLTASTFTRDAFQRAGVKTPIEVVPVPVMPGWFDVPDWRPGQTFGFDVSSYVYPLPPASAAGRLKSFYRTRLKQFLPTGLQTRLRRTLAKFTAPLLPEVEGIPVAVPARPTFEISGIVYLHVCNPYDERKNWQDLVAAFVDALGDAEDATLVIKLVANGSVFPHAINYFNKYYLDLAPAHRCRIALIGGYLPDEQMMRLVEASTYYVTATRAEGANLPLMDALAAGRPALSPRHTSMLDYFEPGMGWVIPSTEEPAAKMVGREWLVSSWHRVDVQQLAQQFRESYAIARNSLARYRELSATARERMRNYAAPDQVWPRFREALNRVGG